MTDRELLELAAKAAGIDVYAVYPSGRVLRDPQDHEAWDPLTDDGDALRLAVKLRLEFEWWKNGICVHRDDLPPMPIENSEEDPNAATRRAIVRAAAEIGKQMQTGDWHARSPIRHRRQTQGHRNQP